MIVVFAVMPAPAREGLEKDLIQTDGGELEITFLGHGTLMFAFNNKVIHVDPFSRVADYKTLPKADVILVTHHHFDHFDSKLIDMLRKKNTTAVLTRECSPRSKEQLCGDVWRCPRLYWWGYREYPGDERPAEY
jgi:L-ascorbate metabolism protein UlaG (beta-lactamase superfamily)